MIKLQGKDYLPVAARVLWFRMEHPDWGIETHEMEIDMVKKYARFRAVITNAEGKIMATATKMEDSAGFKDFGEKAESGSIGRALALCGFGTQFEGSFHEGTDRLVDSPIAAHEEAPPVPQHKAASSTKPKTAAKPKAAVAPEPLPGYWGEHPVTQEMIFFSDNGDGTWALMDEMENLHPDQTQPDVAVEED